MQSYRYLKNVSTLELVSDKCIGCGRCIEVCPHQVFSPREKKVVIDDSDACMECGACARNCPAAAILVESGVGCATGLINEWLREHGIGGSGGDCCS